jgi:two-component system response regulator AtoC
VDCRAIDLDCFLAQYQAAGNGTLLLEDIDQASPAIQSYLLAAAESHFSHASQDSNATTQSHAGCLGADGKLLPRWIATSLCQPGQLVGEQRLRRDLFCLLSPATIKLPALRERTEDIPAFVDQFLDRACQAFGIDARPRVKPLTLQEMAAYCWPGNLGQLQGCIQKAVLHLEGDSLEIDLDHEREVWGDTPDCLSTAARPTGQPGLNGARLTENSRRGDTSVDLAELTRILVRQGIAAAEKARQSLYPFVVNSVEKELIAQVLSECENVQTKAAGRLGINRNTLHKKVQEYDLD